MKKYNTNKPNYQKTKVEKEELKMDKNQNIHIKLEINRDPNTGKLGLMAKFDQNAPNFEKDDEGFSWSPTQEERALLNEAFDMITKK